MKRLIVLALISISLAAVDEQLKIKYAQAYNNFINTLCNTTLTDQQCSRLVNNCEYEKEKSDALLKKCYKKSTLTDRERVEGFCSPDVIHCADQEMQKNATIARLEVTNAMVVDETKKLNNLNNCFIKQIGKN